MKPKRPTKKGNGAETAQREKPGRVALSGKMIRPDDAIELLMTRVNLIKREWPNDVSMQLYRISLEMAVDALREKYGI